MMEYWVFGYWDNDLLENFSWHQHSSIPLLHSQFVIKVPRSLIIILRKNKLPALDNLLICLLLFVRLLEAGNVQRHHPIHLFFSRTVLDLLQSNRQVSVGFQNKSSIHTPRQEHDVIWGNIRRAPGSTHPAHDTGHGLEGDRFNVSLKGCRHTIHHIDFLGTHFPAGVASHTCKYFGICPGDMKRIGRQGFQFVCSFQGWKIRELNDGHSGGYLGLACQPDFDGSGTGYEKKRRTRTTRTRSASTPPGECVTRKLVCLNNGTRFRNEVLLSVKKHRHQTPAFPIFHLHVSQDTPPLERPR